MLYSVRPTTRDGRMSRRARRPGDHMLRLRLILVLCLLALTGFSAEAGSARTPVQAKVEVGVRVSKYARRFLGVPYRYGGMSPRSGFDCSGFVAFVYRRFGVALPHYTFAQFELGRRRFIHAPHSGSHVRVERLRYGGRFAGARRVA